ncbi:MAG: AAA family ATPase [Candidatus Thorarchaeota archaeon]|nr:AAA family ATPase [Candidatus Thorarchaeota archaeon]
MESTSADLQEKVWQVITTLESRGLFVHSTDIDLRFRPAGDSSVRPKSQRLPLVVGACVLNALVPRSAMLLVGGHGGGKTTLIKLLGRMMTGKSLNEIDDGVLRGHPQLTEEKMVATLRPGPLMKDGIEEVVWRKFVTGFWKILDEINRLTPHAQNILLSMLAEGELKYYDEIKKCQEFCLYATMNPADSGTFELSPPFLDRFGIAVPITMPTVDDLELILSTRDEKLFGYDELWQVPAVLTEEKLLTIWNLVDKVPVTDEASEFMRSLVREFGACIRVDKSQSEELTVQSGLCDGCHFNTSKSICNNVIIPLSVRAAKDLNRYSKAAAWLVGAGEVSVELVKSVAPLVFWHRTEYVRDKVQGSPYYGDRFEFTSHLVELAANRFAQRQPAIELLHDFKEGRASDSAVNEIKDMARSDLLVKIDYVDLASELNKSRYKKMVRRIDDAISSEDVDELSKVHDKLLSDTDFPNRSKLVGRVSDALHRLTLSQYTLTFEQWKNLWTTVSMKFPKLTPLLKETLKPPKRKVARTDNMTMVIYTTGASPNSSVFFEISGGRSAVELKHEVEEIIDDGE